MQSDWWVDDAVREVVVLDADLAIEAASRAVAGLDDGDTVVVVDRQVRPWRHHPLPAALVRVGAQESADGALLRSVLTGWPAAPVIAPADLAAGAVAPGSVVVHGDAVLGLVVWAPDGSTDRGDLPGTGYGDGGPPASGDGISDGVGEQPADPVELPPDWEAVPIEETGADPGIDLPVEGAVDLPVEVPVDLAEPQLELPVELPVEPVPVGAAPGPPAPAPPSPAVPSPAVPSPAVPAPAVPTPGPQPATPGTGRFRGMPQVTGPSTVEPGHEVELTVGFRDLRTAPTQPGEAPLLLAAVGAEVAFEVQATGFGLDFPGGTVHALTVPRDTPWSASAVVTVRAQPVAVPTTRTVEVTWVHQGVVVGSAWADLLVTVPGVEPAPPPQVTSGGTGAPQALVDAATPDLTVTVVSTPGTPDLLWQFASPHTIPVPAAPVQTQLDEASAMTWAAGLMTTMEGQKGRPSLDDAVRGVGAAVARALPLEFWQALEPAWVAARAAGRTPTLLVYTSEPWVPWELASVVGGQHVAADLLGGATEVVLGQQWSVGRWPRPVRQNHGPDLPASPPATSVTDRPMAVVVGDYSGAPVAALPHAVAEGKHLADTYGALPLGIEDDQVDLLMSASLTRDGRPYLPTVVHVAAHGETTVGQPALAGIKLKSATVLGVAAISGSRLGRSSAPLVFLNACRVGTAGTALNSYGGVAGAFVESGCRGFIAPLWNVDDDLAAELSTAFYAATLATDPAARTTVGEAVRTMRLAYDGGARGSATPLAYVYYGHPSLRLEPDATPVPEDSP